MANYVKQILHKLKSSFAFKIYAFFSCIIIISTAVQLYLSNTYYSQILEKNLLKTLEQQLNTVQGSVDKEVGFLEQVADQVIWSERVTKSLSSNPENYAAYSDSLYAMVNYLRNIRQSQDVKLNMWVHFLDAELMVSSIGNCEAELYFRNYEVNGQFFSPDAAQQYPNYGLSLIGKYKLHFTDSPSEGIAFLRALPSNRMFTAAGYVYINLEVRTFDMLFQGTDFEFPMLVYVMDQNNNFMYSYSEDSLNEISLAPEDIEYLLLSESGDDLLHELTQVDIKDQSYLMSYNSVSPYGLRYINFVPQNYVNETVLEQNVHAMNAAFLCLLAGLVLSLFFTRNIYNPIRRIVHNLSATPGIPLNAYEGEIKYIAKMIGFYQDQNSNLKTAYSRSYLALKEAFFRDLLRGDETGSQSLSELLEIRFHYPDFQLILFDSADKILYENTQQMDFEFSDFLNRKLQGDSVAYCCFWRDRQMLCLINIPENNMEINDLGQIISELLEYSEQHYGIDYSAVIARLCHNKRELPAAYTDLRRVAEEYLSSGSDFSILYVEDLLDSGNPAESFYSIEQEKQLLGNVLIGNLEDVERQLDSIFSFCRNEGVSSQTTNHLFHQLIGSAYRAAERQKNREESEMMVADLLIKIDENAQTKTRILLVKNIFCLFTEQNGREKNDRKKLVYQKICKYIEENYHTELSLKGIGVQLGYSPSYLSWIFKETSGVNFVDFLNDYRILQAKILMDTTDLTISEIAIKVGYIHVNTFIKRFKKQEGITPGNYRTHR